MRRPAIIAGVMGAMIGAAGIPGDARAERPAGGVAFQTLRAGDVELDVITVDLKRARLRLLWEAPRGRRLGNLGAARELLERRGETVLAVTNAGIFGDRAPVGLHVEEGRTLHPLERAGGAGNFYLKPNGVFFIDGAGAHVLETEAFARRAAAGVELATQSGPLLLNEGHIHPAFAPHSANRLLRSAIGVGNPDTVYLVITRGPIRFHDLAVFFRDRLGCSNALYLDGVISRLYAPALGRTDEGGDFMGMIAVTTKPEAVTPSKGKSTHGPW